LWAEEEVEMRDERCAGGEDDGLVCCTYCKDGKEKEEEIYIGFDVCWNRAFEREGVLGAETVKTQFFFQFFFEM
jgi:hypothetical protein